MNFSVIVEARRWLEQAAAAGNGNGIASLAALYQHGMGVEQDNKTAVAVCLLVI